MSVVGTFQRHRRDLIEYTDDSTWWLSAPCRDFDADTWFPTGSTKIIAETTLNAQRVCVQCPVRPQCARRALDGQERHGIWAGYDLSKGGADRVYALQRLTALADEQDMSA